MSQFSLRALCTVHFCHTCHHPSSLHVRTDGQRLTLTIAILSPKAIQDFTAAFYALTGRFGIGHQNLQLRAGAKPIGSPSFKTFPNPAGLSIALVIVCVMIWLVCVFCTHRIRCAQSLSGSYHLPSSHRAGRLFRDLWWFPLFGWGRRHILFQTLWLWVTN